MSIQKSQNRSVVPRESKKFNASYGMGELIDCMMPSKFDLNCIMKNLEYMLTKGIGTIGLSCSLNPISILGNKKNDVNKKIELPSNYEGHCRSIFGYGEIVACDAFDFPSKAASMCQTKCIESGKPYTSSGCNGNTLWCTCGGLII